MAEEKELKIPGYKVSKKMSLREGMHEFNKKEFEEAKIGDKVSVASKKLDNFTKEFERYKAFGIVIKFNPEIKKYLIRFTAPEDEKDFEKYFKRKEFRLLKKNKKS